MSGILAALAALFFLSGASGLIYQVLWLRLLALVFGVTVYAASTVLASFMGGLALGSLLGGRVADRTRRPLVWFGAVEALVGVTALATPTLLDGLSDIYRSLHAARPDALAWLTLVRFLCSSAVLVVPTMLMGATLPLVVKSSLLREESVGQRTGLLYATNTAGAILGTLVAGFYLIGHHGIATSFRVAATVNLLVGAGALVLSAIAGRLGASRVSAPVPPPREEAVPRHAAPLSERTRRLVLVVFALSGFVSLALEIIWFRVLVLVLPATTYAFTTMLATVLAGIAVGGYLVTPLMRRRIDWVVTLAGLEMLIAVASALSMSLLSRLETVMASAGSRVGAWIGDDLTPLVLGSALSVFPATILMGIAFPIGVQLWVAGGEEAARKPAERLGILYSLNVGGAILGSIVAGFALLPWLGSRTSLVIVASLSFAAGLLLLASRPRTRRIASWPVAAIGTLLFVPAVSTAPDPFAVAQHRHDASERLFWREEGVQTTVSVHVRPMGGHVLYLDGLHQANDSAGMVLTHRQIGHLAMALHPDPSEVLVVGLGGGVTAGAVSQHAGSRVDVVELSASVARASTWFKHVNEDVLGQPNVRLRVDDGRNYVSLTERRYDVITADIIQPEHAGAGNLYSVEYFRLARAALQPGGLMLQWIGHRPETHYKLIMRTFLSVFPQTTLWVDGTLMVGGLRPLQLDREAFERKLRERSTRAALETVGWDRFDALLASYTAGPSELRRFVGDGPLLTDDRPMIEYFRSLPRGEPPLDLSRVRGGVAQHVR